MVVVFAGMFQTSQCIHNPAGASGSSTMSTKLLAFAGVFLMVSGGLMSFASQVYFLGMGCLFLNAWLVMVSCFMFSSS